MPQTNKSRLARRRAVITATLQPALVVGAEGRQRADARDPLQRRPHVQRRRHDVVGTLLVVVLVPGREGRVAGWEPLFRGGRLVGCGAWEGVKGGW